MIVVAAGAPAGADPLYPTNACVSQKLRAAAVQCQNAYLQAAASLERDGTGAVPEQALMKSLVRAWKQAEAESLAAGVDCAETTLDAIAVAELLAENAEDFANAATAGISLDEPSDRRCWAPLVRQAANVCAQLLQAQAREIGTRNQTASPVKRDRMEANALRKLDRALTRSTASCTPTTSPEGLREQILADVDEVSDALTISPALPVGEWVAITPEPVEYRGRLLEPLCSKGTPYHFFARRGTVDKLLVYYQGGGACWSYLTCEAFPIYKESASLEGDDPTNFDTGFADLSNPENPFRDWNVVFVPYCTGDVHWGEADYEHQLVDGQGNVTQSRVIHHRGFVNAQVAEKYAREHFVDPDQVFVTGSSAGAYGAILNSLYLRENVYPWADFAVLGDAGNGVITDDFLQNDLAKWGIEKNLPTWIDGLNVPLTELDAADLYIEAAHEYPAARFANYTTAYDGGNGGQTGFYQVMRFPDNPLGWVRWWDSSCLWNEAMLVLADEAAATVPNYRFYVGTGSAHTMWGRDLVYTSTAGGVPTLVDWVSAMLAGNGGWTNVLADDFGVLLEGDPRPQPIEPPFTADGRIVCP